MTSVINDVVDVIVAVAALLLPPILANFKKILTDLASGRDTELSQIKEELAAIRESQKAACKYRLCQMLHKLRAKIDADETPTPGFVITLHTTFEEYTKMGGNSELAQEYHEMLAKIKGD